MNFAESVDPDTSFCTLSIFTFPPDNILWAMKMMYYGRSWLRDTPGLNFWKLLGTGKGFGPLQPHLFRYGLLAVWQNDTAAQDFFDNSRWINSYKERSENMWTIAMKSYESRGSWSGKEPFDNHIKKPDKDEPVAVLTRGSIRILKAFPFWKHEPAISRSIKEAPGAIISAGLGEYPLLRQVTFSIWENEQAMEDFAHHKAAHAKAAKAAFEHNYFSEWMFTRFSILAMEGNWNGEGVLNIKKGRH